jgi:hypothetical protein
VNAIGSTVPILSYNQTELLIYESRFTDHHSRFHVSVISKQAQEFWALLKSYPKQIAMPLSQAREADTRSEDFTSEPVGINFTPAPEVDGLSAEVPGADRTILYFFGGGFVLGSPDTRRKTAGHLALAVKALVLVPNYRLAPEHPFPAAIDDAVHAYQWLLDHGGEPAKTVSQAIPPAAVLLFLLRWPCAIVTCRCAPASSRSLPGPISPAAARASPAAPQSISNARALVC